MTQAANLGALGTNAGTTGILASTGGGTGTTAGVTGFKNRIINGAMVIDQRNAGASVTPGTNSYTVDRWIVNNAASSKLTAQQSSTAPTGFTNSLLVTSTSAYTPSSVEPFYISQRVEGFNFSDLAWGTANAKTVTLSFWVRSSLTGTFGGSFQNSVTDYSYPHTYTISSANTFEYKTVTISPPTSGTWVGGTNGIGVRLYFSMGAGSTYQGTAGSWSANDYRGATGETQVVATNGATFYITGVQLEVGSTATSFDYRPYGTELQLCQRYYAKLGGTNTDANAGIGAGLFNSAGTVARCYFSYPAPMRTKPTVSQSNAGLNDISSGYNVTSINTTWITTTSMMLDLGSSPSGTGFRPIIFTLAASNGYVDVSAEL